MKYANKQLNRLLSVLLLSFGMSGCTLDKYDDSPSGIKPVANSEVTIIVDIPGMQMPSTRSIADGNGEAAVSSVDILVFKSNGTNNPEVLAEHAQGSITSQSGSSSENYKVEFTAKLTAESSATTVVVLANVPAATINAAITHTEKQDILNALTHIQDGTVPDDFKWNTTSSSNYTSIPMYGEYDVTQSGANTKGITNGMKMTDIELVRMLARIDIVNTASSQFKLSEIYIVNYNDAGYVSPAWDTNGELEPSLPTTPMIPSSATARTGQSMAIAYPLEDDITTLTGDIYVYEAAATTGAEGTDGHTNAMCLIVKGTLLSDNNEYYYRIDFTSGTDGSGNAPGASNFDPADVEYMPIYRNHRYRFDITAAEGIGYTDFNDALKSLGVKNNLKASLLVVNESGIKNIVFDGEHYLGIGDPVTLNPESAATANILCITNYSYGWQINTDEGTNGIEYANSHDTDWLSVTKDGAAADKKANIKLETTQANIGTGERTAYVHIIAGTLTHKLEITQQGPFVRITDERGNEITELNFSSKNSLIDKAPAAQTFLLTWSPADQPLNVNKVAGSNELTWSTPYQTSLTGGSYTFTVDPAGITQDEVDKDPFMEKEATLTFALENTSISGNINLKQTHYNLFVEDFESAEAEAVTRTVIVKSNTDWVVNAKQTPTILTTYSVSGKANTSGTPFTYTLNGTSGETKFTFSSWIYDLCNSVTSRTIRFISLPQIAPGSITGIGDFLRNSYVGAFWRADQVGERLIKITASDSGNMGAWSVQVYEYGDFQPGDIVFSTKPSADPGVTWNKSTETHTDPDVGGYKVEGDNTYALGAVEWPEAIFFRVGLKTKWDATNSHYNPSKPVRYAVLVLTYGNHAYKRKIFLRQGHEPDYLMYPGDTDDNNNTFTEDRNLAKRFSPYNLTSSGLADSEPYYHQMNNPNEGVFVDYPTQAGAFFQWSSGTGYERRAYHPTYTGTIDWYSTHPYPENSDEICPPGYRRPDGGDVKPVGNEIWQSLISIESPNNLESRAGSQVWGYYADGFFDRQATETSSGGYLAQNSVVANGTKNAAYIGKMMFNPVTSSPRYNASIFLPACGARDSKDGKLDYAGNRSYIWSRKRSDLNSAYIYGLVDTYLYRYGSSSKITGGTIRCVLE